MNHELAKKLKDAGFPQDENGYGYWYTKDSKVIYLGEKIDIPDKCYIPTLSELIEACGEGFNGILPPKIMGGVWLAVETIGDLKRNDDGIGFSFTSWTFWSGKTPEEAVANLYLELHKA